jgi:hypothetical protein
MTLNCSVSSSAPATTNVVMGYVGVNLYHINLAETSQDNVKIINDFISVIGKHSIVDILDYNIDTQFEANIVIPGDADLEITTMEYPSLSAANKKKVDNFVSLIVLTANNTNN